MGGMVGAGVARSGSTLALEPDPVVDQEPSVDREGLARDVARRRGGQEGHDLRDLTLESVRGNIGLVTQETILFDDTVRLNIAAGRADADPALVRRAAVAAQADDFVTALPDGYDTLLGEDGARLSMGQRQRLTIARALFKDPPFLVLDEATSALDAESEDQVQQAMNVLLEGRGSLVIAHRLATIREADRIIVLQEGRIVEQGTHRELLGLNGLYARLHELQFRE